MKTKNRQIPLAKLVEGRWYVGEGRSSKLGYWDGRAFRVVSDSKYAHPGEYPESAVRIVELKQEEYYTAKSGTFKPFRRIDC